MEDIPTIEELIQQCGRGEKHYSMKTPRGEDRYCPLLKPAANERYKCKCAGDKKVFDIGYWSLEKLQEVYLCKRRTIGDNFG